MINLYTAAYQFIICFACIFSVDRLLAPKVARWYFLHIFINATVSYFAWPDVKLCLMSPRDCYGPASELSSTIPWIMGLVGHIYHMVAFDDLRFDDYLHHLLMFPLAGLAAFIFLQKPGFNYALFGLTGLPGGIDYVLLTLVKLGYIDRYTEKKWNVYIQVWFRMPFIIFGTGIFYTEFMHSTLSIWSLIAVLLSFWNGIFFMHDTVFHYYYKHYGAAIKKPIRSIQDSEMDSNSQSTMSNQQVHWVSELLDD